jgi:hypothetical protein
MVVCAGEFDADRVGVGMVQLIEVSGARSVMRAEDFDFAAGCLASPDAGIGGDQRDAEGFGQGDVLRVAGGQADVQALDARPQRVAPRSSPGGFGAPLPPAAAPSGYGSAVGLQVLRPEGC